MSNHYEMGIGWNAQTPKTLKNQKRNKLQQGSIAEQNPKEIQEKWYLCCKYNDNSPYSNGGAVDWKLTANPL